MFHLLIANFDWSGTKDKLPSSRVFEHTDEEISKQFMAGGQFDSKKIASIPAIFTNEIGGDDADICLYRGLPSHQMVLSISNKSLSEYRKIYFDSINHVNKIRNRLTVPCCHRIGLSDITWGYRPWVSRQAERLPSKHN